MTQATFWFLRHGETDWNVEGRLQGHTDIPLNRRGLAQAAEAAHYLKEVGVERIIASPLSRAFVTAQHAAEALGLEVEADARLMERTFGSWEGLLTREVKQRHGLGHKDSITAILPPDAEQWEATKARISSAIADGMARHPGKLVLFVSHGAVFRALHEVMCGGWREAANAQPYRFSQIDGVWRFESPFENAEGIDRLQPTG